MSDSPRTSNRKTNQTTGHTSAGSSRRRGPQQRRGNGPSGAYRRRGSAEPSVRAESSVKSQLDRLLDDAQNAPAPDLASFAETGLPTPLVEALAAQGMKKPFAIQARTLPDALAGRDILGRAQTGSGKTLGFGLPMLARLSGGKRGSGTPRGLVLVPTRELAKQVADALTDLGRPLGVRIATVFGGAPINRQISTLERGVDLVVATPGRLIDLMERRAVRLDQVRITVLDEADYMADLGFLPAVTRILDSTPEGGQRMLFSATLDRGVDRLVSRYLSDPSVHAVAPAASPVESMDHKVFTVQSEHKVAVAAEVASRPGRTLFFVRTKHGADRLAKQLERQGVEAAAIHGNLGQNARQRALDAFTSGRPRVLVATDVAARGIHVDDVDLVVHFDPPNDHKDYLHRSGRTARAGTSGTVVALVQPEQARGMSRLHREAKVVADVTLVHPGHDAVRAVATSGTPVVVRPLQAPVGSTRPTGRGRPSRSKGRRQNVADRGRRR